MKRVSGRLAYLYALVSLAAVGCLPRELSPGAAEFSRMVCEKVGPGYEFTQEDLTACQITLGETLLETTYGQIPTNEMISGTYVDKPQTQYVAEVFTSKFAQRKRPSGKAVLSEAQIQGFQSELGGKMTEVGIVIRGSSVKGEVGH